VSKEWEQKYPKVRVMTLVRVGLDHNPILLEDGVDTRQRNIVFRFEKAWLFKLEFKSRMVEK
jgi:hypothetical protein